jgi:HlyD family secretion protein
VLVPIEVGRSNERMSQVLSGLSVSDKVVVHPSDRIADGVRVAERDRI